MDEFRKTSIIFGEEEPRADEMEYLWAYEIAQRSKKRREEVMKKQKQLNLMQNI